MKYYQTGDVLYKEISEKKNDLQIIEGDLIHKGRDHSHKIKGNFKLYHDQENMIIEAISDCELTHEEHSTVVLPKGFYIKDLVHEYDHFLEESRIVID
jgi:hypothetical protein